MTKRWTHNATGKDYFELDRGPFAGERCRVNDYDFVVAVSRPGVPMQVFPQALFKPEDYRGATLYYGQMQTSDPVEKGDELIAYKAKEDGKTWFRPEREWATRMTCISDM